MKVAIKDFKNESERYIDNNYSPETDEKYIQLDVLSSIIEFIEKIHDEEEIME